MRRALLVIVVLAASSSAALAHVTKYSWTVKKAEVALPEAATIAVPPDVGGPLLAELNTLLAKFRLLELTAQQERNDWLAAGTYGNYVKRFGEAREKIQKGLSVDSATCSGSGKAVKNNRYKHFRCDATSYVLEVPTVELRGGENGTLPEVVEGPVRRFGPYEASFTLHVTGSARSVSRRLS